jgi:hypothetical protein
MISSLKRGWVMSGGRALGLMIGYLIGIILITAWLIEIKRE